MNDKPITIRAQFGDAIYVSHHRSYRRPENWRYHAREIADMAVSLGADWAQGWIPELDEPSVLYRACWIVSMEAEEALGLTVPNGQRRLASGDVWTALEERQPITRTAPPAWIEG